MPRREDDEENETRTKRKVHPGLIEADNEEVAIVVHFETSEPPSKLRTPHVRRLRLKTLDERSDPEKIADDVMRKCKYIPSSKRRVVEMLVANLQDHLARNDDARQNAQDARERRRRKETNTSERASIDDVDDYVELLYEGDIDTKIRGTSLVLSLCGRVGDLDGGRVQRPPRIFVLQQLRGDAPVARAASRRVGLSGGRRVRDGPHHTSLKRK